MIPELTQPLRREFTIESVGASETRTAEAVLSTESPIKRWGITEILSHDEDSIDISRAERGLPLLWNHDPSKPIGKAKNLRFDGGKLRATLHFSANPDAAWVWQDVRDGFLDDVSIGYTVSKWEVNGDETEYTARKWELLEASVVTVPADKAAGMHRSFHAEEKHMSDDSTTLDQGAGSNDGAKVVEVSKASFNRGKQQGKKEALGELQSRVRAINDLFDQYVAMFPNNEELRGLHMDLITSGATLDQARAALLAAMPSYIAQPTGTGFVQTEQRSVTAATPTRPATSVRDEVDSLGANVEAALLMRCGLGDKEQDKQLRESGVGGLTFVEMGRRYLEATGNGSQIRNLDKHGVAKVMLMRAGPMTHSDFPYLLANVATKIAKKGYTEANTTYQNWANIAYLPDFKPATIPGLGAFTDLDLIPQTGAPYVYGTMGEAYETATLATYGKLFGISRAAIVNDDLMQFSRAGLAMGAAAARKVNQLAYAILTAGQTMSEDSVTLWDVSTHANYVSSSGAAPSVTTLNVGEKAMGIQKAPRVSTDSTNAYLNISPGHLVVPLSLKATSSVLIESMYDPAGTAGTLPPNPWRGRLSVTADALLDANSTTAWYLIAPKGNSTIDTVTVFFLEGSNGEPYIEEEQQFSSDGVSYKVRIDAVARALDWRGMYKNAGT